MFIFKWLFIGRSHRACFNCFNICVIRYAHGTLNRKKWNTRKFTVLLFKRLLEIGSYCKLMITETKRQAWKRSIYPQYPVQNNLRMSYLAVHKSASKEASSLEKKTSLTTNKQVRRISTFSKLSNKIPVQDAELQKLFRDIVGILSLLCVSC